MNVEEDLRAEESRGTRDFLRVVGICGDLVPRIFCCLDLFLTPVTGLLHY